MKNHNKAFVCPHCLGSLSKLDNSLKCIRCLKIFPVLFDIPSFVNGSSDWQFSSSESSEAIIESAKKSGWRKSLINLKKDTADWISGTGRFAISVLASPKECVLDAGCGWGGLSFWLAREFGHVYALDAQLDGLQFINIRAFQEGISNITTVKGSVFSLPFPSSFFDVVVLNGVLEWVGTFSEKHPPGVLQEMTLKEIERVIKPNGTLNIAIENRYGIQYLLGYKEEHTGLRYISLLPRKLARKYHQHRKGKDFRALTHSRSGLMKMLKKAGFNHAVWFSVFPSYRNCRYAASLQGFAAMKFIVSNFGTEKIVQPEILWNMAIRVLYKSSLLLRIASFFSPSWIVFASRKNKPELALQSKEDHIAIRDSEDEDLAITVNNRRANIFKIDNYSQNLLGKYSIPINQRAEKKIRISTICLELIRKLQPDLAVNLPEVSIQSTKDGLVEYTKAVSGCALNLSDLEGLNLFHDFLINLSCLAIPNNEIQGILLEFDIRDDLSLLAKNQGLCSEIQELTQRAQIMHGDLNKSNIFISKGEPHRAIVIDFEHVKIGPSVLNWYDFLLRNFVIYGSRI